MSQRPDVAVLLQQLSNELRDLSARVGLLEVKVDGLQPRIASLEAEQLVFNASNQESPG
jgi:prefoldin subunit 5